MSHPAAPGSETPITRHRLAELSHPGILTTSKAFRYNSVMIACNKDKIKILYSPMTHSPPVRVLVGAGAEVE